MQRGRNFYLLMLAGAVALAASTYRRAYAGPPPSQWKHRDIGDPAIAGSTDVDDKGVWTVKGSGGDLWGSDNDHFQYVSTPVTGDGSITARMLSTTGGHLDDGWEKTGVMIRADDDPDSAMVHTEMTNRNSGVYWHWRDDKGGSPHDIPAVGGVREFPIWMRTQRVGNDFAGFTSYDGALWRNIGWTLNEPGFKDAANFGLCVMSHSDDVVDTVQFDNVGLGPVSVYGLTAVPSDKDVKLQWKALKGAESYNVYRGPANVGYDEIKPDQLVKISSDGLKDTSLTDDKDLKAGERHLYAVAGVTGGKEGPRVVIRSGLGGVSSDLPGFESTNIGSNTEKIDDLGVDSKVGDTGADFNPTTNVIRIRGGGHDIWDQADDFNFTHQKVSGDFQVIVQALTFPSFTNEWAKGGLMVREDLTPGSRFADVILASVHGLFFQWRTTKNDNAAPDGADPSLEWNVGRDQLNAGKPITLRLTRKGDVITAEYSTDGTTFQKVGDDLTIGGLAKDVEVGLCITSHDANRIADMAVRNLKITQ
jgi:hypothetical protein